MEELTVGVQLGNITVSFKTDLSGSNLKRGLETVEQFLKDHQALFRRSATDVPPASSKHMTKPVQNPVHSGRAETSLVLRKIEGALLPKTKHLTDSILYALGTKWGKTPRDWGEIAEALKQNALHYSKGSITGTLTLLTQSGKIRRIKAGHSYKYVLH